MTNLFNNLRLFDDRGYEIPLKYFFNFSFEINFDTRNINVIESPQGYIIGDQYTGNETLPTDASILCNLFSMNIVNKGKIYKKSGAVIDLNDNLDLLQNIKSIDLTLTIEDQSFNKTLTFINSDYSINNEYSIEEMFNIETKEYFYKTGDSLNSSISHFEIENFSILPDSNIDNENINLLTPADDLRNELNEFVINSINSYNSNFFIEKRISTLFPYFKFYASYDQEKVSTDLVSSTTFFLLDSSDNINFNYPICDTYDLKLYIKESQKDLRFITNTMEYDHIDWSYMIDKSLEEDQISNEYTINSSVWKNPVPLTFSIGFLTNIEGIYQNNIEFYITNRKTKQVYSIGSIAINSESVDEDERYRTLFANFGIPDPIEYPEVFKENDPLEEGKDFQLINRKSKELFLTYDQIFPYAGTYKALINAVRYLGYTDIIFKEWYRLIDYARKSTNVSYQSIDLNTRETLEAKLDKINLSVEDFLKYKKLNQISLIYQINKQNEETETIYYTSKDNKQYSRIIENPTTIPVYEYQTNEVLIKLYSLKKWLEKYIIPVNCHISDITGEGVYFYRYKNNAYHTVYETAEYEDLTHITPYTLKTNKDSNRLIDSSAKITCSLYEFNSIKIKDYSDFSIRRFINKIIDIPQSLTTNIDSSIKNYTPEIIDIERKLPISNPLEAVFSINDYSYEIENNATSGTLEEYAKDYLNPIYIDENEIYIYNDSKVESIIDKKYNPNIIIRSGNIRKCYGDWQNNIIWTIKEVIDQSTGNTYYQVKNVKELGFDNIILDNKGIILTSDSSSEFKYTEKTKYNVPVFIISNYKFNKEIKESNKEYFDLSGNYILEILEGELQFKDKEINIDSSNSLKEVLSTNVLFSVQDAKTTIENDQIQYPDLQEQYITPIYKYRTSRIPIYEYKSDVSNNLYKITEIYNEYQNIKNDIILSINSGNIEKELKKKLLRTYIKEFGLFNSIYETNIDYSKLSNESIDSSLEAILGQPVDIIIESDKSIQELGKTLLNEKYDISEKETIYSLFNSNKFVYDLNNYRYKEQNSLYVNSKFNYDLNILKEEVINENLKKLNEEFSEYLKNSTLYKVNKLTDIKVNHIGDYNIIVKGYDKYNNIFVNEKASRVNVYGVAPKINIFTNSRTSNTNNNSYIGNKVGIIQDSSIVNIIEKEACLPKIYRINSLYVGKDINRLSYYNISYAIDTPKKNDYFYLNNLTEQATGIQIGSIDSSSDEFKNMVLLTMLDENPDRQELYIPGLPVNVYLYNENNKKLEEVFENLIVQEYYKQEDLTDSNYYDDSYLLLYDLNNSGLLNYSLNGKHIPYLLENNYKLFVGNIKEIELNQELVNNNYINKKCKIKISGDTLIYHKYDVIKIIYKTTFSKDNYYYLTNTYLGETSYRIIDAYIENGYQVYIIDGLIDINKWNYPTRVFISYANTNFVNYVIRVTDDAREIAYHNKFNNTLDFTTDFIYDASQWLGYEYIDNTYSGYSTDFNIEDVNEVWINNPSIYDNKEIYKYQEYPVSLDLNRYFLVNSEDTEMTYNLYKTEWCWITNSLENVYNWDNENHQTFTTPLFRLNNNMLSLIANQKGRQDIELTTIDLYGNKLTRTDIGKVFIS